MTDKISEVQLAALNGLIDMGRVLTYEEVLKLVGLDYKPKEDLSYEEAINVIRCWNNKERGRT